MHCLSRLLILASSTLVLTAAHAQTVMKPGGWRMETQITSRTGAGTETDLGRQTMNLCLTKEFLAKEPYLSANVDKDKAAARGAKCTTSDYGRKGDAAAWRMACEMNDGSTTDARIHNKASTDKIDLEIVQQVTRGDTKGTVTIRGTGKYIGECTPEMNKP